MLFSSRTGLVSSRSMDGAVAGAVRHVLKFDGIVALDGILYNFMLSCLTKDITLLHSLSQDPILIN